MTSLHVGRRQWLCPLAVNTSAILDPLTPGRLIVGAAPRGRNRGGAEAPCSRHGLFPTRMPGWWDRGRGPTLWSTAQMWYPAGFLVAPDDARAGAAGGRQLPGTF